MSETRQADEFVVVSHGMLGYGFPEASLDAAVAAGIDLIAVDAGSTDPGPFYLGSGKPFVSEAMVARDLELLIRAGDRAGVPLVIGSAGGAGNDDQVDFVTDIVRRLCREMQLTRRIAVLKTELDKSQVIDAIEQDRVRAFETGTALEPSEVEAASRIVAQIGCESMWPALRQSPDILICGRAWDVANVSSLSLLRGFPRGLALHMGKILECGAQAAEPIEGSDLLMGRLRRDHFIVEPPAAHKRCTIDSVAAHTFYEKTDPVVLAGPGGTVDLRGCQFEQLDERRVKVSGSAFREEKPYTVKLEGAKLVGHRHVCIGGVRDPIMIRQIDGIQEGIAARLRENQAGRIDPDSYSLRFHRYGLDGVMGPWEPVETPAHELGLLIDVVADTPEKAEAVCAMARSLTLHWGFEGRRATAGNLALPFSPADMAAGPVYAFNIYHLMEVERPEELFPHQILAA